MVLINLKEESSTFPTKLKQIKFLNEKEKNKEQYFLNKNIKELIKQDLPINFLKQ